MMKDGELVLMPAAETASNEELHTNSTGALARRGDCVGLSHSL